MHMRTVIVGLVLALLVPGLAWAQRRGGADETKARALYDDAVHRYDLAEYDKAIEEFKEVYLLTNRPELLFNLAQSHRAKHDYDTALHFYRTYLKLKPSAANRGEVLADIDELDKALRERDTPRPAPREKPLEPPAGVRVEQPVVAVAPMAVVEKPRFFRTTRGQVVIALVALSAVSLIGAAASGGVAVSRRGSYDDSCNLGACNDGLYSQGRSLAIATDVLIGVGAAAAVVAVIVAVTRPKARARQLAALRISF